MNVDTNDSTPMLDQRWNFETGAPADTRVFRDPDGDLWFKMESGVFCIGVSLEDATAWYGANPNARGVPFDILQSMYFPDGAPEGFGLL